MGCPSSTSCCVGGRDGAGRRHAAQCCHGSADDRRQAHLGGVGRQAVAWAWATLGATLLMGSITPVLGWAFAIGGGLLGAWYVTETHQWLDRIQKGVPDRPMRLFSVSITHMTLLSIAIAIDVLV